MCIVYQHLVLWQRKNVHVTLLASLIIRSFKSAAKPPSSSGFFSIKGGFPRLVLILVNNSWFCSFNAKIIMYDSTLINPLKAGAASLAVWFFAANRVSWSRVNTIWWSCVQNCRGLCLILMFQRSEELSLGAYNLEAGMSKIHVCCALGWMLKSKTNNSNDCFCNLNCNDST